MTEDESALAAQRALDPKSESVLNFHGKQIRTAAMQNGQGYVLLRGLCEAFDLSYSTQRQRVYRTTLFQDNSAQVYFSTPGGRQAQLCLSAFAVPAFLMGIETGRIASPDAKALLEAFQHEGMIILAEHFGLSERGEIEFLRESLARMVVQQDRFEAQMDESVKAVNQAVQAERQAHEEKVQQIRDAFGKMRDQIRVLENKVGPKQRISTEQIGELRERVMVLGELLIRAGESKRPWPMIYSDITLQFGFAAVADITIEAYPKVEEFLNRQIQAVREALLGGQAKPPAESLE